MSETENNTLQIVRGDDEAITVTVTDKDTGTALDSAKRRGKPFIHIVHNDMWQTSRMLRFMNGKDLAVFNTNWIMRQARGAVRKIVVHPPIDHAAFKTKTTREYVTLVNLTLPKGVDVFYTLAGMFPDVQFLGVLGGYWKHEQVVKKNLPNVTIIENTPNMRDDVYAKSKIILMPSTYETYGMVAAEAMVSGIPVIATPTAGLKENLGNAGVYARRGTGDIQRWHDALYKLLNDPKYYQEVSKACIKQSKVVNTAAELKAFVKAVGDLVNE